MTELPTDLDISPITDYLYISSFPRSKHTEALQGLGVRLILSMHWIRPHWILGQPPLRLLWLPTFDNPMFPIPLSMLRRGVEAALPVIQEGEKVLVHCRYGIHRSVAMACCVLIGHGETASEAMQMIKERRTVADPNAWYIQRRILLFEQQWRDSRP